MKTNPFFRISKWPALTLTIGVMACQNDAPDATNGPNSSALIAEISETTQSADLEGQSIKTFSYDNQRLREIKWTFMSKFKNSPDQRNIQNTETFSYDSNGFLRSKTLNETLEDLSANGKRTTQKSIETQYTYQNERLILEVEQQRVGTQNTTSRVSYEYNTTGKLLKRTWQESNGTATIWNYTDGELKTIVKRATNGSESQPCTVQNGVVVREEYPDKGYVKYDYDEQKRLTKATIFAANGQINSYYTNTWTANFLPEEMLPPLKGHPSPSSLYFGKKGVLTKYEYFASINNQTTRLNESTYTHQIQGGLIRSTILKNEQFGILPNDPVTVINTITKYIYLE